MQGDRRAKTRERRGIGGPRPGKEKGPVAEPFSRSFVFLPVGLADLMEGKIGKDPQPVNTVSGTFRPMRSEAVRRAQM